jgi:hypothetical protein
MVGRPIAPICYSCVDKCSVPRTCQSNAHRQEGRAIVTHSGAPGTPIGVLLLRGRQDLGANDNARHLCFVRLNLAMRHKPMTCRTCEGARWVCEAHADRPWGARQHPKARLVHRRCPHLPTDARAVAAIILCLSKCGQGTPGPSFASPWPPATGLRCAQCID